MPLQCKLSHRVYSRSPLLHLALHSISCWNATIVLILLIPFTDTSLTVVLVRLSLLLWPEATVDVGSAERQVAVGKSMRTGRESDSTSKMFRTSTMSVSSKMNWNNSVVHKWGRSTHSRYSVILCTCRLISRCNGCEPTCCTGHSIPLDHLIGRHFCKCHMDIFEF